VQAAYYFAEPLDTLIYDLKYHGQISNARLLAEMMAPRMKAEGVEALLPVPIHPLRRRQRGYNQAELLCESLGKQLNIPVINNGVSRIKETPSQTHLSARKRRLNLNAAFSVNDSVLKGLTEVALVDDVITTAATVQQIALDILKQSDIQSVQAWSVAKTQ